MTADAVTQVTTALLNLAHFRRRRFVRAHLPPGELTRSGAEAAEVEAINSGHSDAIWPPEHTRWVVTLEMAWAQADPLGILVGAWGEPADVVERRLAEAVVATPEWQQRHASEPIPF